MKNILVIDDSLTVRKSVEFALKINKEYNILSAVNGLEAIKIVEEVFGKGEEFVLCITDINMPEMNGVEFTKEFRKLDKFTPILVLTTEVDSGLIEEGKEAGASAWINKPFSPEKFRKLVDRLIK